VSLLQLQFKVVEVYEYSSAKLHHSKLSSYFIFLMFINPRFEYARYTIKYSKTPK